MKRLFLLLAVLAAFGTIAAANSTVVIDGITYQQLNDTEAELVDGVFYHSADLVIPAQVQIGGKQLSVASIKANAFHGNTDIVNVEMPNTVKLIGDDAFCFCSRIRQITLSGSLKQIGKNAFYYCHDIKALELPASLTSVGDGAFYYCKGVDSLFISRNLVNIGVAAFAYCGTKSIVVAPENTKYDSRDNCNAIIETATGVLLSGCTNTVIPDGVKIIEELAFFGAQFQTINLPSSLTEIRKNAFLSCYYLKEIEMPDALVSLGDSAFYQCSNLSIIKMGHSLKTIGKSTFEGCNNINELTLSNSLQAIGDFAFYNSRMEFEELILPESLISIGSYAFGRLVGILETPPLLHRIHIGNNVTTIGDLAFSGYRNVTQVDLSNSLTHIGEKAFSGSNVESIVVPASYTIIEPEAFATMGLKKVTLLGAVTEIGFSAFWGNNDLKECVFQESLQSIGDYAFADCGLESLVIPNSVTFIGESAFDGCTLASITIGKSLESIGRHAFASCKNITTVNWNARSCADTEYDFPIFGWPTITTFNFGNEVEHVPAYICMDQSSLKSITIPPSVNSIGTGAFVGCSGLESMVVANGNSKYDSRDNCNAIIETGTNKLIAGCKNTIIPNSVVTIGKEAFYRCSSLTSLFMPNSVKTIGVRAFKECTGLTGIEIGNSVTSIDYSAFSDCTGLTNIVIGNSVTSIGSGAFSGCWGLTSISIPNSVVNVGDNAFATCTGLTSAIIGNSVTSIGHSVFLHCISLDAITIGNSVTSIADDAFKGCTGLRTVNWNAKSCLDYNVNNIPFKDLTGITTFNFGNQVKHIPAHLCHNLSGLTSVSISNTVTSIGELVFANCTSLSSVNMGNSVTTIGGMTFATCSSLASITIPASVTSIGLGVFWDCTGLNNIYSYINHPADAEMEFMVFQGVKVAECTLHVIEGRLQEYRNADQWKDFVNIIDDLKTPVIPGDVSGDGKVNVSDVTVLINMILGIIDTDDQSADVNGDGKVNVSDITALINIILGVTQ